MLKKKKNIQSKVKILFWALLLSVVTILFAHYVSTLLFTGKSSLKVYNALLEQKALLEYNIKNLQLDNARLQKEYFELKNLEPEDDK